MGDFAYGTYQWHESLVEEVWTAKLAKNAKPGLDGIFEQEVRRRKESVRCCFDVFESRGLVLLFVSLCFAEKERELWVVLTCCLSALEVNLV